MMITVLRYHIAVVLFLAVAAKSWAWSDHASLGWPLFQTMPDVIEAPLVEPESLKDFLVQEAVGLQQLLADQEIWARDNLVHYSPRPDGLAFDAGTPAENIVQQFAYAIRINPTLSYSLYRQLMAFEDLQGGMQPIAIAELTFLQSAIKGKSLRYVGLDPNVLVMPIHVVAAASDEPDFGMDVDLYEDSGTEFGDQYGFGDVPFGNSNLDYGTQAPFHMGFYYLDYVTRTAQPGLLKTYPEYRTHLYKTLATYAFQTGHPYWGWRFLGWGLHYVGDMSQPYHAVPLPGVSTWRSAWQLITGHGDDVVQLVSNRHGAIESFQQQIMHRGIARQDWQGPIMQALAGGSLMAQSGDVFTASTLKENLARESSYAASNMDSVIKNNLPAKIVSDPNFELSGSAEKEAMVELVFSKGGQPAVDRMTLVVADQLERFARYTRSWVRTILQDGRMCVRGRIGMNEACFMP